MCTSTPEAVAAGVALLEAGGNAVDAAIAAAAALVVTEPTGNGLGGDAFAIVHTPDGRLHGLNASGRAPRGLARHLFDHLEGVPTEGWLGVTVPGVVSGWCAVHDRFGRLPLARVLAPAIALAGDGFPVSPVVARQWHVGGAQRFGAWNDAPLREAFADTWLVAGPTGPRAPRAGERFVNPALCDSLERIAHEGGSALYTGELGRALCAWSRQTGGVLAEDDLASHRARWVEPVGVRFGDAMVFELPPNGQGLVASLTLRLLDGLPPSEGDGLLAPSTVHRVAECLRLAIVAGHAVIADPDRMRVPPEALVAEPYVQQLRALFSPAGVRGDPASVPLPDHGTVYLAVADDEGHEVSWIQSCYMGFGSGVVVPRTGISLQNRGCGFTLERGHPNEVGPGRRPFHTIIPGWLRTDGGARAAFGVMGGPMQPQGHVQLVSALLAGLTPRAACALPRYRVLGPRRIAVEEGAPEGLGAALEALGHELAPPPGQWAFGGAQVAWRASDGVLTGGTEPRKDGGAPGVAG